MQLYRIYGILIISINIINIKSNTIMELEEAIRRLNIVSAELAMMEKEIDDQMKKYMDENNEMPWNTVVTATTTTTATADVLKMFEQWGNEMLSKQGEVELAKRVVISCEVGKYKTNWDNNELVIWHYNGYHYLRNKNNYVYWQNSGKWAGMYIEDEYRLDEDAAEPDFVNEPPPLVSVEIVEWKCNKRMGCRCN